MYICIIRHGEANSSIIDRKQGLSHVGMEQARKIGKFIGSKQPNLREIWHSPKLRAKETAVIIRERLGKSLPLVENSGLLPHGDVMSIASELEVLKRNIIIVSHLPFVAELAEYILKSSFQGFVKGFPPCGAVLIDLSSPESPGLVWFTEP